MRYMFLAGLATLTMMSVPATAQDLSGPYVGVAAAHSWGRSGLELGAAEQAGIDLHRLGLGYGLTGGWNVEAGDLVYGLEADLGTPGLTSGYRSRAGDEYAGELVYLATMRGRIGYRLDTIMPYVTGGVAWGSHEVTATGPAAGSWSGVQGGYAVGIGAELPAADDISLKLEYLYTRLEPHRFGAVSQDLEVHAFRVGLNFHF